MATDAYLQGRRAFREAEANDALAYYRFGGPEFEVEPHAGWVHDERSDILTRWIRGYPLGKAKGNAVRLTMQVQFAPYADGLEAVAHVQVRDPAMQQVGEWPGPLAADVMRASRWRAIVMASKEGNWVERGADEWANQTLVMRGIEQLGAYTVTAKFAPGTDKLLEVTVHDDRPAAPADAAPAPPDEHLEKVFTAADRHGEDTGEPDHTVGDLHDVLRAAWELMSPAQRVSLMATDAVRDTLGGNGFDVDDPDLADTYPTEDAPRG